jgi:Zinc finger, C3HC4 type (RING finger)
MQSEPPSIPPGANKSVRTRRRLHEAEVISTTPCTAPRRSPQGQQLPPNTSLLPMRSTSQVPVVRRDSSAHDSVNGTVQEYSRISNKTGGFEGSLPLQYDLVFADDDTLQFNNTVQSSPEMGKESRNRGGRGGGSPRRYGLFQIQRRLTFVDRENPQQQRRGFFNRWTSIGSSSSKQNNSTAAAKNPSSQHDKPQKDRLTGEAATQLKRTFRSTVTFTAEDISDRSFSKSQVVATPVRRISSARSPRFMLPDETPGSATSKSRKSKGSIDNTSAALAGRHSHYSSSDDQGFELSIASAPATYLSPRRERSAPVDLDEVDPESSSHDDEGVQKTQARRMWLFSTARSFSTSPSKRRQNETKKPLTPRGTKKKSLLPTLGLNADSDSVVSSNFSVAPLQSMEDLKLETTAALRPPPAAANATSNKLKNWVVAPMRRKGGPLSTTAVSLLEKERRQRKKRESDEVQSVSPDQRESIFANIELVEKYCSAGRVNQRANPAKNTSLTQSTVSSSKDAVVKLPRCVVCNGRDRTHIAIPCMHFAYCRDCAMGLAKKGQGCVLCSIEHVTFAAVSV